MNYEFSFWEKQAFLGKADALIIGSGIVGISTAIHYKKNHPSKRVLVLERGPLPSGASTKNAGFACIGSPSEVLDDLEKADLKSVLNTIFRRWKGLLYLRELLGDEAIDYRENGSYELFRNQDKELFEKSRDHLDFLNKHMHELTGINNNYSIDQAIIRESGFKGFDYAISNRAEGQINTGRMMKNLIRKAYDTGVEILSSCEVISFNSSEVITSLGCIKFNQLALCTNGFTGKFFPDLDVKPARAQVLITEPIPQLQWKGIYHFDRGYYYFRNVGNRILFGGGRNLNIQGETTESLTTTDEIIAHLEDILLHQIHHESTINIDGSWAGIMGVGQLKNPIVKQINENTYCAVRLGGMGVAIGSLIGNELADMMGY